MEPSINYAAAIWAPYISNACFDSLQKVQNAALRIATGCHKSSTVEHLHMEAKFPLVEDHLLILSSQHLASALRPTHPSHAVVTAPHGPRNMKETLGHKCEASVAPYLSNGVIDPADYRLTLKKIHTDAIANSIKSFPSSIPSSVPSRHLSLTQKNKDLQGCRGPHLPSSALVVAAF